MRRKVVFEKGEYYHIYNRGANRDTIFRQPENYLFFLERVNKYIKSHDIRVIAYCLMPNHYHFLLRQNQETGISAFIQAIFNSYSKAFNKMYNRTGTLFQGRFQSVHIEKENYLIHLCRYIHRNPIEANLVTHLEEWPYSNYLEWIEIRNGSIVDHEFVRTYFRTPEEYIDFVHDMQVSPALDKYTIEGD